MSAWQDGTQEELREIINLATEEIKQLQAKNIELMHLLTEAYKNIKPHVQDTQNSYVKAWIMRIEKAIEVQS